MNKEKAAEIIEEMISHEESWLKDFGRVLTRERIEALEIALKMLREEDYGKEQCG